LIDRISGQSTTPEDVTILAVYLSAVVEVLEISADYPNRGRSTLIRRYLTCRVTEHTREVVATLGPGDAGNCNS
jgi:hypothetical protein